MSSDIKLVYEVPCRCCRSILKNEKTLCYLKNGQIIKVTPKKHWRECVKQTRSNDEKLNCEWLCYKFEQLYN